MTRLPMVGLETDIARIIEENLDVWTECRPEDVCVTGVEDSALAVVKMLRERGVIG